MNDIDISLILAQLFNFLILFFLFKYFIAEQMHKMIEERKKASEKLEHAELHFQEMENLSREKSESMIEEARKTSQKLRQESEELARIQGEHIIEDAHYRAQAILESGQREIEKERISMLTHMKSYIVDISLKLSQKVLGDAAPNKEFIENELEYIK